MFAFDEILVYFFVLYLKSHTSVVVIAECGVFDHAKSKERKSETSFFSSFSVLACDTVKQAIVNKRYCEANEQKITVV